MSTLDNGFDIVNEVASTLARQLTAFYPCDQFSVESLLVQEEETQIKQWIHELSLQLLPLNNDGNNDILKSAIPLAVNQWKSNKYSTRDGTNTKKVSTTTTTTKSSFSLFDQMFALNNNNLPIPIEDIINAPNEEERLVLLLKLEHADDIVFDWSQLQPILQQGLTTTKVDDNNNGSNNGYLNLHWKWFGLARVSSEYATLQHNLCCNVMRAIHVTISTAPNYQELSLQQLLIPLIQLWRYMWIDLMQRGIYLDHDDEIELGMLSMMRAIQTSSSPSSPSSTLSYLAVHPAQILAIIDKDANWFSCWISQVPSMERLIQLLEKSNSFLSDVVSQCQSFDDTKKDKKITQHVQHHSVSVLAAILRTTRASMFPWHLLLLDSEEELLFAPIDTNAFAQVEQIQVAAITTKQQKTMMKPNNNKKDRVQKLLNVFVQHFKTHNKAKDSIQILLIGCMLDDSGLSFDEAVHFVRQNLDESCDQEWLQKLNANRNLV